MLVNISICETQIRKVRCSNEIKDRLPHFIYHLQLLEYKFHKNRAFVFPLLSLWYGLAHLCARENTGAVKVILKGDH